MRPFENLFRLFFRFRYPVSMPEDVAEALGVTLTNDLSFEEFIHILIQPQSQPTRLAKFMPRQEAEEAFKRALRKERFKNSSLYSYYFNEGWLEFVLLFDESARLRRVYLIHKQIPAEEGVEIALKKSA